MFGAKGKLEPITPLSGQRTLLPPAGSANITGERVVPAQKATEWAALAKTDHGQSSIGAVQILLDVVGCRPICLTRR